MTRTDNPPGPPTATEPAGTVLDPEPLPLPRRRRRRRSVTYAAAVVATLAAAGTIVAVNRQDSAASPVAAAQFSYVRVGTATLTESETVSGKLEFDDTHAVTSARSGILTERPADGTTVSRGQAAYRIDEVPGILLYGDVPMYRKLRDGVDDGPDVRQLEQNLQELGYSPGTVNNTFGARTAEAVREWQDDLDLDQTGTVGPGDIVFASGALRAGTSSARPGDTVAPGTPLFSATSTTQVVTVDLDAGRSSLAVVGSAATVTLPDGRQTQATLREVGSTATPVSTGAQGTSAEPSAKATIPLTLTLDTPADAGELISAPVTVALTRDQKADVVAVPVTALVALSDGGYAVRLQDSVEPRGYRPVPVRTGLYASGQVEITSGLTTGQTVAVPT